MEDNNPINNRQIIEDLQEEVDILRDHIRDLENKLLREMKIETRLYKLLNHYQEKIEYLTSICESQRYDKYKRCY